MILDLGLSMDALPHSEADFKMLVDDFEGASNFLGLRFPVRRVKCRSHLRNEHPKFAAGESDVDVRRRMIVSIDLDDVFAVP